MILNCHSDRFSQTPLTDYLRFKPFCITKDCVLVIWYINVATVELFNPANRQMAKLFIYSQYTISFNHSFIPRGPQIDIFFHGGFDLSNLHLVYN